MDADAFTSAVLELLRHNDRLPLRLFFARAVGDARPQLRRQGPSPDLEVLLDRLAQTAGIALAVDDQTLFEQSLTTLRSSYRIGVGPDEYSRPDLWIGAVKLWWSIVGRIEAIGAAAVRAQAWPQARLPSRCSHQPTAQTAGRPPTSARSATGWPKPPASAWSMAPHTTPRSPQPSSTPLGDVSPIMPGSRRLAPRLAALSSVPDSPKLSAPLEQGGTPIASAPSSALRRTAPDAAP
ncbi:hypothetical protein [Streptomyces sp. enrichment culture]|uniref:hypothetical protein n=1 Tax=Streptomyces sp. enrichment culture TaxID=1795815 RepID=UPI003F57B37B